MSDEIEVDWGRVYLPAIWNNAKAGAHADCPQCHGTGTYMYDENHGAVCDICCRHNMGWWQLEAGHGVDAGKWCCKAGCGKTVKERPDDR